MSEEKKMVGNPIARMAKYVRIRREHPEMSEVEALLEAEKECIEEGKINPFKKIWNEETKASYLRALERLGELNRRLAVEEVMKAKSHGERNKNKNKG